MDEKEWKKKLTGILSDPGYGTNIRKAGIFCFPSNYRFETHCHKEYEINYINTGACIMEVGDSYVTLKAGECIVIAPGNPHCFVVDARKNCRITQLELVITCTVKVAEGINFLCMPFSYHKLHQCGQLLPLLERICYYRREGEGEVAGAIQIDLLLLQLYVVLSEEMGKKKEEKEEVSRVKAMIRFIHENLEGDLNLEQLSARFQVSSRYVRKYFEKQMGMRCNEYITLLRIRKAKQLLWNPDYSITETAMRSGFSSSQYFGRVFRKHVGMTPVEYRKHWLWTEEAKTYSGIT